MDKVKSLVIGVDLGGTNTVFGIVNARGEIVVSSINEIPDEEVEVPVYTEVSTGEDGTQTYVTSNKDVYKFASIEIEIDFELMCDERKLNKDSNDELKTMLRN